MWWRAEQSSADRAALRALAKVIFAAVFLIFALLGGTAEACLGSKQAASSTVTQKIERVSPVPTVIVSAAPERAAVKLNQGGSCCGAGCQTHSAACGSGCCGAGYSAVGLGSSSLFSPINSVRLSPFDQAKAVSAQPPPDLRPPRILI